MKTSILTLLGVGALGTFALCDLCGTSTTLAKRTAEPSGLAALRLGSRVADSASVALDVRGMTCGGCAIATRKVLQRLAGVRKVDVSYDKHLATIVYDPTRVTVEQMIAAVKKLGYTATVHTA